MSRRKSSRKAGDSMWRDDVDHELAHDEPTPPALESSPETVPQFRNAKLQVRPGARLSASSLAKLLEMVAQKNVVAIIIH